MAGRIHRRIVFLAPVALIVGLLVARYGGSGAPDATSSAGPSAGTIASRLPPPRGFEFVPVEPGSFAEWLTRLPLKPGRPPVRLHNGQDKLNQLAHHAVVDMDVGDGDLQQCADAVIRLRAEYLWATGRQSDVHFNFTSGDRADYARWRDGYRPSVTGERVAWQKTASRDDSYDGFRAYLSKVFEYAGTASLSAELSTVKDVNQMRVGDVFIRGGFPGHAVIVVNMARIRDGRKQVFLLAQSYTPAQDIHILRDPVHPGLSPWYPVDFGEHLVTPEYVFRRDELKRF
jgi:hypothetical protein